MHIYSFEKLEVWQEARRFCVFIYQLTNKFPAEERFGLTSQLRRAAVSVAPNIAEGAARTSPKDQANFYQMAYGSAVEMLNQFIIAADLSFLSMDALKECREKIASLTSK